MTGPRVGTGKPGIYLMSVYLPVPGSDWESSMQECLVSLISAIYEEILVYNTWRYEVHLA